jgi:hypothetical protein
VSDINDGFGDAEPFVDPTEALAALATTDEPDATVAPEGTVRVATRRGYKFILPNPGDGEDLVIGTEPVRVPEATVDELIKASNGRLFVVPEDEEE